MIIRIDEKEVFRRFATINEGMGVSRPPFQNDPEMEIEMSEEQALELLQWLSRELLNVELRIRQ